METQTLGMGRLSVVGLGYIGLPTVIAFANVGWDTVGVDVSPQRVDLINQGKLPFVEDGLEQQLEKVIHNGSLRATTTPEPADVFIISVPTPFNEDYSADLTYIDAACDAVSPFLVEGNLVVLESTVPPGVTEHMAERIEAARPDLVDKLLFAHSPERVLPGRIIEEMTTNDRIVGGLTPEATQRAFEVYSTFCQGEISTTDARTAELSKLVENSFRDVNIAFANEISLICEDLDIDVWEVIELANHHPRVNILNPGPGVGGHCIAVDPWFIVAAAPERARLIRTARQVNDGKPQHVIEKVNALIEAFGRDARVALLGLAFKPDIDDLRSSPALDIAERLVVDHPHTHFNVVEPNIAELPAALSAAPNATLTSLDEALTDSQIYVVLIDHTPFKDVDPRVLVGKAVIDTRGIWR